VALLVLAAILGVPISAAAYGFLALVTLRRCPPAGRRPAGSALVLLNAAAASSRRDDAPRTGTQESCRGDGMVSASG
jgi:hypothetical protein